MPAALEPLPISITTLPELSSEPVPDPDIEITSDKEETFEPTEDSRMEVALMSTPTEYKAGLPEDFSGKNEEATCWLLAMKAYFGINDHIYKDDKTVVLVFLNKMSKGRGGTFAKGWYIKVANPAIPDSEKMFKKLCDAFEEIFIPKNIKDRARQTVYSLNMDQFNSDFDQYATAFRLAQAHSRIDLDSILVDALQQGVTNQLAIMITATALLEGQDKTGWKWEQWLNRVGEFYQNVIQLRKLWSGGNSYIPLAQNTRATQPTRDPYAMDVDKINLSPSERAEHMKNHKCFICHKEGCHSSKHKGYPRRKERPQQQGKCPFWRSTTETREFDEVDPWVSGFMKQHEISAEHAIELMGNYYSYNSPTTTWERTAEEELVNEITQGF